MIGTIKQNAATGLKGVGDSILHWTWTKALLYWLIISAGTMSELAFLVASLWMSVSASVHPLVLSVIGYWTGGNDQASEQIAIHISEMATTAYVALPECILALAFITTLGHIRTWLYDRRDLAALIWSVLYGAPTLVFLVLSMITLGCSVVSVTFTLPGPLIIIRALAGFIYAFASLLYWRLGGEQETDRLRKKDDLINDLIHNNRELSDQLEAEKAETARLNQALTDSKNTQKRLIEDLNKSADTALEAYGEHCLNWLRSGIKTATADEINQFTGHSKQKISHAIRSGNLQVSPRNKELVLISSLIEWLKNNTAPVFTADRQTEKIHAVS